MVEKNTFSQTFALARSAQAGKHACMDVSIVSMNKSLASGTARRYRSLQSSVPKSRVFSIAVQPESEILEWRRLLGLSRLQKQQTRFAT